MTPEFMSFLGLALAVIIHLISTVWWAASITRRVDHVERWITHNEHTAERLAALEQSIDHIRDGIERIEDLIRHGR